MEKFRKLTPHDLAFGIGRKATKEELEELFSRPLGKTVTSEELLAELKERNQKKKIKKAS
jgi:predicted nucleic acid-binding protein